MPVELGALCFPISFNTDNHVEGRVALEKFAHTNEVWFVRITVVCLPAQKLPIAVISADQENWALHPEYVPATEDTEARVIEGFFHVSQSLKQLDTALLTAGLCQLTSICSRREALSLFFDHRERPLLAVSRSLVVELATGLHIKMARWDSQPLPDVR